MVDFDRIGAVLSSRLDGVIPLKFFCSCRALLAHAKVSESDIDRVWNLGRDKKISICFALGISLESTVLLPNLRSQLKSFSLSKGIEYALEHPNVSLKHFMDPSVPSIARRKYADSIMKGFSLGHFDISDEFMLMDLMGCASKSITQSASVTYNLYVQSHFEVVRMLVKTYDMRTVGEGGLNVLHMSARDGKKEALSWFIENGGDVNVVDTSGWSPLSHALRGGHAAIVSQLLEMKVCTDLIDSTGNSLLHLACMSGSLEVVTLLWDSIDENGLLKTLPKRNEFVNSDGMSCLHIAAKYGHWKLVEWCLEKGFDPNKADLKGMSPLHHAAASDSSLSIEFLHARGALYPDFSMAVESPLDLAIHNRQVDVLGKLFDLYDLISDWSSAFRYAFSLGYSEVIDELLKKDSSILESVSTPEYPLTVAVKSRNSCLVRVLLRYAEYFTNKSLSNCFILSFLYKDMELLNDLSSVMRERPHKATDISPIIHLLIKNQSSLVEIISKGDCADLLGFVLDWGISVDTLLSKEEQTFLVYAENRKHSRMLNMLICRDLEIEAVDLKSTLIHSCKVGHSFYVGLLLKFRVNVNGTVEDGWTPLMSASQNGHPSCIKLLLDAGASIDAVNSSGKTSLMIASESGHSSCVELLLGSGANVNASTENGQTSLMLACESGHASCVELLLKGGAAIEASMRDGWTALMCAVRGSHSLCVELLLNGGATLNLVPKTDSSPSSVSVSEQSDVTVDDLKGKSGPDVNAVNAFGKSLLMRASQNGHSACIELLLRFGADVNLSDEDGWTSVMLASLAGHTACVDLLLKGGADVNASSDSGWTALMCASRNGHSACVDLLMSRGALVNAATKDGWTALMCASQSGHISCIDLLLKASARVNLSSKNGLTSLMFCCQSGYSSCAELLLKAGAHVNASQKGIPTPLMCASQNGHSACVKLLKKFGALE